MLHVNDCYFGWILTDAAANVGWVAYALPDLVRQFPFALITSKDSNRNKWLHSAYLAYLAEKPHNPAQYHFTIDGILISGPVVYDLLINKDFFSGFDEIWLSTENIIEPLPRDAILTSEASIIASNTLNRRIAIAEWIAKSKCSLGIADGCGMNYATTSKEIAVMLETKALHKPK